MYFLLLIVDSSDIFTVLNTWAVRIFLSNNERSTLFMP